MTPDQFIAKWQNATLKERSAAQEHFLDLCQLLNEQTPVAIDPAGEFYCFERGAKKAGCGDGWADVWKRGHFGWEYKSPGKNLAQAFKQLQLYAPALEHPPLLIVSDMDQVIIHTAFTGTVPDEYTLTLEDLRQPEKLQLLKWAFSDPERLRPLKTTADLTERAARQFAELADVLCKRGYDPIEVAHFSQQVLFCFFAQDIGLLPAKLLTRLLESARKYPKKAAQMFANLFETMADGGLFGLEEIDHFNGGLFATKAVVPLSIGDIGMLYKLADWKWSAIEPSIFGTLFERGLNPQQREQLGAHYTDPNSILRIINPVVLEPLRLEWAKIKAQINEKRQKVASSQSAKTRNQVRDLVRDLLNQMLLRLRNFRVLDPACGSGNFLFLTLKGLKDLEHEVILEEERLGFSRSFPLVGPENVLGIETNVYAAELARVTVWIGEIQWMLNHGFSLSKNPILKQIEIINQHDSIVDLNGKEPNWSEVDVIVGNPPFLGDKRMRGTLGEEYVKRLRGCYRGRISGGADLVCYWFERARVQIESGKAQAAGFVVTNSIRGGKNRKVLDRICAQMTIFHAWSDEPWINEGAAVRVSLICFGHSKTPPVLNNEPVAAIYADLTASDDDKNLDLTTAKPLTENANTAFIGTQKSGDFDIPGELARQWLKQPNVHSKSNTDVLRPWVNGMDIVRRYSDTWIIDFGVGMSKSEAAFYQLPFQHITKNVQCVIENKITSWQVENKNTQHLKRQYETWWQHWCPRPDMRKALTGLSRYLCTPRVAKHRLFVWLDKTVLPDSATVAIARTDDTTFGILHSRFHELWSLRMGTSLGGTPRYTPTTTFETFPFPIGLTPADTGGAVEIFNSGAIIPSVATKYRDHAVAIAEAAFQLNQLREHWLNPPEWIERVPEVVAGYPERIIAKSEFFEQLKQRTLTNLYNEKPGWLINAHQLLDHAVAAAYGWSTELSETEILQRLLALNLAR